MHLPELISDLAIILGVAAIVTLLFQKIKQPVVLGYIVAGVIVGPHTPYLTVADIPNIKVLAELGVIFLMFSLGLEFSFRKLARVGVTATTTTVVEVVIMMACGFATGKLLGWATSDSLFLGAMLSISSTTIIIKAFEGLKSKASGFSNIVFGILIVEDLVAILLLVGLTTMSSTQTFFSSELIFSAVKLILVVGSWLALGFFFVPVLLRRLEKYLDDESLMIISVGLCLTLVAAAAYLHYSSALGAFIMGSILAETRQAKRIESLIAPLRNLFAAVFFVSVGMLADPMTLYTNWWPILLITLVTIAGKIGSTTLGALLTGQPVKRSLQIGFSLAQIGEFSFIIATLGITLGATSEFLFPIGVAVSVITTFTTPYLIQLSQKITSENT